MHPRRRLDISWSDLAFALWSVAFAPKAKRSIRAIQNFWQDPSEVGVFLSIRTSLDLLLQALNLPAGSEVIMSAVTISGMIEIVQAHGLTPVALDLDPDTLSPNLDSLKELITDKTKAIIIVPLFGTRFDLSPIAKIAKENSIILIEDCAQSFTGFDYQGHPSTDVVMFSFGPIKTATALGGAVVKVRDRLLLKKMNELDSEYSRLSALSFFKRIFKFSILKFISYPSIYGLLIFSINALGKNYDQILGRAVRGFSGVDLLTNIRHRPSHALLNLIGYRLRHFSSERIDSRSRHAQRVLERLTHLITIPGRSAQHRTFWVFPINSNEPDLLVTKLYQAGFDATRGASNMCVVPQISKFYAIPEQAQRLLSNIVYLPVYPELSESDLERLVQIVLAHGQKVNQVESSENETQAAVGALV